MVSDHSGRDPLGSVPISHYFKNSADTVKLSVSGIIIPKRKVQEGILLKSTSAVWREVAEKLGADWTIAYQLSPENWEEIVVAAFKKSGCQATFTPRSGDHGRDVIATKPDVGYVKIIGSVEAYKPGNIVSYDHYARCWE